MSKELEKKELSSESVGSALVELAMRDDVDADKLEKLIDLQTKLEDRQANKALNEALANFQAECPIIKKTKVAHNSTYAPLDEIVYKIKPLMDKYGLSFSFSITDVDDKERLITVTIRHTMGASYNSSYKFPNLDEGGKMNSSQRTRSANSYAKRTALENALGIVTANADDDAQRAIDSPIKPNQIEEIEQIMELKKVNREEFFKHFKVSGFEYMSEHDGKRALTMLKAKKG